MTSMQWKWPHKLRVMQLLKATPTPCRESSSLDVQGRSLWLQLILSNILSFFVLALVACYSWRVRQLLHRCLKQSLSAAEVSLGQSGWFGQSESEEFFCRLWLREQCWNPVGQKKMRIICSSNQKIPWSGFIHHFRLGDSVGWEPIVLNKRGLK